MHERTTPLFKPLCSRHDMLIKFLTVRKLLQAPPNCQLRLIHLTYFNLHVERPEHLQILLYSCFESSDVKIATSQHNILEQLRSHLSWAFSDSLHYSLWHPSLVDSDVSRVEQNLRHCESFIPYFDYLFLLAPFRQGIPHITSFNSFVIRKYKFFNHSSRFAHLEILGESIRNESARFFYLVNYCDFVFKVDLFERKRLH